MNNQIISGVYCIENTINNKKYIGSSKNIAHRFKRHLCYLRNKTHVNKHLQSAITKYGIENFKFFILEKCSPEDIFKREQYHIESYDWDILYNKTKIAGSGGADVQRKPIYLLDLFGNIVKEFKSGLDTSNYLNQPKLNYRGINTHSITRKKYRLVTPEFYNNHIDIIKSWKTYTCEYIHKKELYHKIKYLTIDIFNIRTEHALTKTIAPILGISNAASSLIIIKMKKKNLTEYIHKKSGTYITFL